MRPARLRMADTRCSVPSTPAQMFHMLRRQMLRATRKPLVVMTPKSMLRHKLSVSRMDDLVNGSFQELIADVTAKQPDKATRVVICAGKVYYDLFEEREKRKIDDVYLLRLEQLYPFPVASLMKELARFPQADMVWCQEEPKNQGGWTFVEPNLEWVLTRIGAKSKRAAYAGRAASASPATGLASRHKAEQEALVNDALGTTA